MNGGCSKNIASDQYKIVLPYSLAKSGYCIGAMQLFFITIEALLTMASLRL